MLRPIDQPKSADVVWPTTSSPARTGSPPPAPPPPPRGRAGLGPGARAKAAPADEVRAIRSNGPAEAGLVGPVVGRHVRAPGATPLLGTERAGGAAAGDDEHGR